MEDKAVASIATQNMPENDSNNSSETCSTEVSSNISSFESKISDIKIESSEIKEDLKTANSLDSEINENKENKQKNENQKNAESEKIMSIVSNVITQDNSDVAESVVQIKLSKEEESSTFVATEPHEVQSTKLTISSTQPTLDKELLAEDESNQNTEETTNQTNENISITNETLDLSNKTSSKDDIMSSRTLKFTVNSLLDSIINEGADKKKNEKENQKPRKSSLQTTTNSSNISNTTEILTSESRKERLQKKKQQQEEAAARLSKPRPKPKLEKTEETKKTRKVYSKHEQKEASERLSKARPVVSDIDIQNVVNKPKKKVVIRSAPSERLFSSRTISSETQNEDNQPMKIQKAPKEFRDMMLGKPKKKKISSYARDVLSARRREVESIRTREEIQEIADKIVSLKKNAKMPEINDSGTIADVCNEISNRRIAALNESDYIESMRLQKIVDELRKQFRLRDREHFHEDYMRDLNRKLISSKESMNQAQTEWDNKIKELQKEQKEEMDALIEKQDNEMYELEEKWQSPETMRKFTKKSPQLLIQQTMEKNMALTGDLVGAYKMSQVVKKNEMKEASHRFEDMKITFEKNRDNLLDQQEQARGLMKNLHDLKMMEYVNKQNEAMEQHKKRIQALERVIADESDIDKFCAKKFKKTSDVIVPMTATANRGDDIPSNGKMRATVINTAGIMSFREKNTPTPLQLPTLKVQRPKSSRRQKSTYTDDK